MCVLHVCSGVSANNEDFIVGSMADRLTKDIHQLYALCLAPKLLSVQWCLQCWCVDERHVDKCVCICAWIVFTGITHTHTHRTEEEKAGMLMN